MKYQEGDIVFLDKNKLKRKGIDQGLGLLKFIDSLNSIQLLHLDNSFENQIYYYINNKNWHKAGHKLILFTMRSNRHVPNETGDPTIMDVTGMFLDDAVNWFKQNDIPLYGINENPTQKTWTNSPKSIRTIIY